MIVNKRRGLRGFGTASDDFVNQFLAAQQARQAGAKAVLATSLPPQLVPITEKPLLIDTPIDMGLPSVLTDGSGKLDPTRLAIFGLGAIGLVAGIFMLKTKRS